MPSEGLLSAEPSSGKAQPWVTQCAHGRSVVLCVQAVAPGDSPCTEMSAFGQQRLNPWSNESAKCKIISNASFILITNVLRKVIMQLNDRHTFTMTAVGAKDQHGSCSDSLAAGGDLLHSTDSAPVTRWGKVAEIHSPGNFTSMGGKLPLLLICQLESLWAVFLSWACYLISVLSVRWFPNTLGDVLHSGCSLSVNAPSPIYLFSADLSLKMKQ